MHTNSDVDLSRSLGTIREIVGVQSEQEFNEDGCMVRLAVDYARDAAYGGVA